MTESVLKSIMRLFAIIGNLKENVDSGQMKTITTIHIKLQKHFFRNWSILSNRQNICKCSNSTSEIYNVVSLSTQ